MATEYGETLIEENAYLKVHAGRLDAEEIGNLIQELQADCVVDATHPYAAVVSENIQKACKEVKRDYIRLLREADREDVSDCVFVNSVEEAAVFLAGTTGKILAATGSKELHKYTVIPDYKERVTARVLSTPNVAEECAKLGFVGKNLICMQGPFSEELNTALLRQNRGFLAGDQRSRKRRRFPGKAGSSQKSRGQSSSHWPAKRAGRRTFCRRSAEAFV